MSTLCHAFHRPTVLSVGAGWHHHLNSELSDGDKLFLVEFMNTYAPTGALFDPREEIMEKLADIELTWGERLRAEGRDEGRDEGKLEGERKMLLHLVTLMFGEAPAALVAHVNALQEEAALAALAQEIVKIQRLEDLVLPDVDAGAA